MYSDRNLETPPPQSQFRRPWSPDVDPHHSSSSLAFLALQDAHYGNRRAQWADSEPHESAPLRSARREASESSVEALDLADYARTLRIRQTEDAYPPFPSQIRQQNSNAPSSFPSLIPGASTDHVPSLVSRGPTISSVASNNTLSTIPRPSRRPFSLPPAPSAASHSNYSHAYLSRAGAPPRIADPYHYAQSAEEIDISRFPKWSRGWYDNNPSAQLGHPAFDPDDDLYSPLPPSQLPAAAAAARTQKSIFDPRYVHDPADTFDPYDERRPALSSAGHASREVLPWGNERPDYGPTLDPMLKEERMRMLQKEFGTKEKANGKDSPRGLVDEEGKPLVGTIDEKGNLVTVGPKRRVALKVIQVIFAAAACIPAIYGALVLKAKDPKNPPPPANKPATFVLYILSSITLLTLLYMFAIRPCFVRPKPQSKHPLGGPANMGMMVLPVGNGGPKKKKKPKGGKKGQWGPPSAQDVQVNLIVDPAAFQPPEASESETDEEDEEASMPGGFGAQDARRAHEQRKRRNRRRRRRGVFEGLAMEAQWRVARAWTKKLAALNAVGLVLWSGTFVYIMTGKRCPSGGFNGWCNAYNVSIASACLLAVSFAVGIFFNVQDLHASKQSPRTRS